MTIETWVEEFLWRGRHSGDPAPASYHVVIGSIGPETLNKPVIGDAMTPSQAAAAGFTLAAIVTGINQEALTSRDAAIAASQAAETERDQATKDKETAEAERDASLAREAEANTASANALAAQLEAQAEIATANEDRDAARADRDVKVAAITAERDAAVAALPVVPPNSITTAAFQTRFTDEEQAAIWALAAKDVTGQIGAGLTRGLTAQTVDLTAPGLLQWMEALVDAKVITADRETEILKP